MVYQLTIRMFHRSYNANHLFREELKLAFDMKIDEMIKLMDGHIRQMHSKYPGDNIVGSITRLSGHKMSILTFAIM